MKKRIVSIFAAVMICAAFTGCGDNTGSSGTDAPSGSVAEPTTKKPAEKTAELKSSLSEAAASSDKKYPELVNIEAGTLNDRFVIDDNDVAEFSAYICGSGAMPEEFGIFVAKDADAAKRVAEALNKRVEMQRKTFKDYTPDEMYKFDDCFVETNGSTVVYAICSDNEKAKELLK
ncbi:MAG: DUF4358 domain-containing protein [Oscillospiraceae bacterium]|nr:DUF4358 domain-containing protein [Oscillospiraceae bacterium]